MFRYFIPVLITVFSGCTVESSYEGWILSYSIPQKGIYPGHCTHGGGCNIICDTVSSASSVPECIKAGPDGVDCEKEGGDNFCETRGLESGAVCTESICYPAIIPCSSQNECPPWFICNNQKCVETPRLCTAEGCEDVSPQLMLAQIYPVDCSAGNNCAPWEICDETDGHCKSIFCNFRPDIVGFHSICAHSHQCVSGSTAGLLESWPPVPEKVWLYPGDCVKTVLCETDEECILAGYSLCDSRNTCINSN
ncbi:MAG: hypothetical protein JXR95_14070 [Deltaproteobacteria bacterium]|nr:hypothetical protein [Deltaproteobacteria bacterium]